MLVADRLLAPGSEWRLHREWFSAARWPTCSAKMPSWRRSISCTAVTTGRWCTSKRWFYHLVGRRGDLFSISYDALLYDLTQHCDFEVDPPFPEGEQRVFWGHPRLTTWLDRVQIIVHRSGGDARRFSRWPRGAAGKHRRQDDVAGLLLLSGSSGNTAKRVGSG